MSGLDNGRADVNSARYIFVTHVPSRTIDVLPPYRKRCEGALLAYRHLDCLDVVCARKKGVAEVPVRATGFVIKRVRMCVRAHDAPASKCAAPTLERCALMRLTTADVRPRALLQAKQSTSESALACAQVNGRA